MDVFSLLASAKPLSLGSRREARLKAFSPSSAGAAAWKRSDGTFGF